MTLHPTYSPTSPCEAKECPTRTHRLAVCFEQHCPFAWQRQGAEDKEREKEATQ